MNLDAAVYQILCMLHVSGLIPNKIAKTVQLAIYIHTSYIHGFDQSHIENIQDKNVLY